MRHDYPFTSYLMLVRPEADAKAQPLLSSAVIVVESANCGIEYAEPKDILWETLWEGESPFGPGKLHSFHRRVVRALCVDGTIVEISKSIDRDDLKALLHGRYRPPGTHQVVVAVLIVCLALCTTVALVVWRAKMRRSRSVLL